WTEHGDTLGISTRGDLAHQNVGQGAPDEIPGPGELFRQMNRSLSAADVVNVVNYVVAGQNDLRRKIAQRDVQDRTAGRRIRNVADVRRGRRGRQRDERGATQNRLHVPGDFHFDLAEYMSEPGLELLRAGRIQIVKDEMIYLRQRSQEEPGDLEIDQPASDQ